MINGFELLQNHENRGDFFYFPEKSSTRKIVIAAIGQKTRPEEKRKIYDVANVTVFGMKISTVGGMFIAYLSTFLFFSVLYRAYSFARLSSSHRVTVCCCCYTRAFCPLSAENVEKRKNVFERQVSSERVGGDIKIFFQQNSEFLFLLSRPRSHRWNGWKSVVVAPRERVDFSSLARRSLTQRERKRQTRGKNFRDKFLYFMFDMIFTNILFAFAISSVSVVFFSVSLLFFLLWSRVAPAPWSTS